MSDSAALEVQIAMVERLAEDSMISAQCSGVLDGVPEGQQLPYIAVGTVVEAPWNAFRKRGKEVTVTFDVYWQGYGDEPGLRIIQDMNRLLDGPLLALQSYDNRFIECEMWATLPIEDQAGVMINHATGRFRTLNYPL